MKKLKYTVLALTALISFSCSDWTETEDKGIQKPEERSEEYYAALREYKKSDHEIVFGWFGNWDPENMTSPARSFKAAPDSVDMLSLWGWGGRFREPLSEVQKAEIKYMQEVRGTKIVATLLLTNFPEGYEKSVEGARKYGEDLALRAIEDGFAGFDIDWEPGILGGTFEFENHDYMEALTREIAKYFGPKSGSGRLLLIDGTESGLAKPAGERTGIRQELIELFDMAIFQEYNRRSDAIVQSVAAKAVDFGWLPEQIIFTVDFEKWAPVGGGEDYTLEDGKTKATYITSLASTQLRDVTVNGVTGTYRKGGIGVYHIQNDYSNQPDFKYVRESIQIMNPAGEKGTPKGLISKQ